MKQPNHEALTRPFADSEILHFQGRGGFQMSYVEDESVMDRLDEAFGIGAWSLEVEPIPYVEGVVKVRLIAGDARYEDFGYPNREGGEQLKEAVSDGIRRVGRMLGIARDLYRKDTSRTTHGTAPSPVVPAAGRGSSSPRPAASTVPPEPDWIGDAPSAVEAARTARGAAQGVGGDYFTEYGTCPDHGATWKHVPAGTSKKTGKPYGEFWSCPQMDCREKPTQDWVNMAKERAA